MTAAGSLHRAIVADCRLRGQNLRIARVSVSMARSRTNPLAGERDLVRSLLSTRNAPAELRMLA